MRIKIFEEFKTPGPSERDEIQEILTQLEYKQDDLKWKIHLEYNPRFWKDKNGNRISVRKEVMPLCDSQSIRYYIIMRSDIPGRKLTDFSSVMKSSKDIQLMTDMTTTVERLATFTDDFEYSLNIPGEIKVEMYINQKNEDAAENKKVFKKFLEGLFEKMPDEEKWAMIKPSDNWGTQNQERLAPIKIKNHTIDEIDKILLELGCKKGKTDDEHLLNGSGVVRLDVSNSNLYEIGGIEFTVQYYYEGGRAIPANKAYYLHVKRSHKSKTRSKKLWNDIRRIIND